METNNRFCIAKDGAKWRVYDNELKTFVGDKFKGYSKSEAKAIAKEMNKQSRD